jgi:hypothetical protein
MAVRITHIRISGSAMHENISHVHWIQDGNASTGTMSKAEMVNWIDVKGGHAYVASGASKATVAVVKPQATAPYLRTHADGTWNNNLLSLPRF